MVKRKWQQCQELILFAFYAPSPPSHCTNSHLSALTWRFFFSVLFFFLATKTLDGGSGREEGTRQPVATKPVVSLSRWREALETSASGSMHNATGWQGVGLSRVIDLFPSPSPLPFLPFPCWVHCIPQLGSGWLQQGAPSAASQSAKSKRGS